LVLDSNPLAVHFHFRLTTVGRVTIYNVHGWNVGGHLVIHNGIVGAYLYEDERGYSGTLELVT
jgi:predicted glutamine amidotransferase